MHKFPTKKSGSETSRNLLHSCASPGTYGKAIFVGVIDCIKLSFAVPTNIPWLSLLVISPWYVAGK